MKKTDIINQIIKLNHRLIPMLPSMPIGLLDGKMGYCIYFYILGKYDKRNRYDSVAENLMEDIYSNILNTSDIEVETGLAGIGLGIDYLIKEGYVSGDVNVILEDIDDSIFRKLNNRDYCRNSRVLSLLYLLIYLCTRYEKQRKEQKELLEELIGQTFNALYAKIDQTFYEEPFRYSIHYKAPLFLYLLARIWKLGFFNYRIERLFPEIEYSITTLYPKLGSNKLYLLWGMNHLEQVFPSLAFQKHINLLKNEIDIERILKEELRDKNLFLENGVASLFLIVKSLKSNLFTNEEVQRAQELMFTKIESSDLWELLNQSVDYLEYFKRPVNNFNIIYVLYMTKASNGIL